MRISIWALAGLLALAPAHAAVTLTHVHGLAYTPDGKRLLVPSHHGLAVYENGKWTKAPGAQHDYMGFVATQKSFYSSGHPAPKSGLVDPFGLLRSDDGGRTWKKLGLEGETDFHLVAAGWQTNAIYVWNPERSSRMPETGLHFTLDDGASWKRPRADGLKGKPGALASHPSDAAIVALASSSGVFISRDSGERFAAIEQGVQALSVFFDLDGKLLWYGTFAGEPRLSRVPVAGGKPTSVELPRLGRDGVAYIAQNPERRNEYAFATFERSIYQSEDGGRSWKSIARRGSGK